MSFLLLTDVFPPKTGGSSRWFWEIYRRLPREAVSIAAGQHPKQKEFDQSVNLDISRWPVVFPTWGICSLAGIACYAKAYRSIVRTISSRKVRSIHCGTLLPEGWIGWMCKKWHGLPYLCYVHGEELNIGSHSRELGWMMRRVLSAADLVIANSQNTARLLRDEWNVKSSCLQILHPGADTERFHAVNRDDEVRADLGWAGRSVILTVGRLQKRKGHHQLILALELVRQSIPNVLYSIVGDGEERASLEELVRERGLAQLVQFRGESSDDELVRCYQQCDMFVLPNHEVNGDIEGFGMVLVEAQACGKPVVAGDSGGTRETMRVGETGYVVRCQAIDELASIVIDLLADDVKRSRMGYAARSWAVSQFDWVSLAAKAQDIFARFLPPTRIVAPPTAFPEADRPIGTAHETTFPAASKLN